MSAEIINTKQLRAEMPRILRRIGEGQSFLVLHRSRPAFELIPPQATRRALPSLDRDPLFLLGPLGRSADGKSAADHDKFLYQA